MHNDLQFCYLKLDNAWPHFDTLRNLVKREDGALMLLDQAYTGTFLAGPFTIGERPTSWHRLQVFADLLPAGAHVRFYTMTTNDKGYQPTIDEQGLPMPVNTDPQTNEWRAAPWDALDILVLNKPGRYLWIGGALYGDGKASPVLHQMRLTYGHETWLQYLPTIYRRCSSGSRA